MENKAGKRDKTPWPTKAVMEQIYEQQLWGSGATAFYSGEGSHQAAIVQPYLEAVSAFLASFTQPLVVCDLGCGDFNVGKHLVPFSKRYVGVDIVADLIAFNQQHFKDEKLSFHCLDLAKDELPEGDCAILRQVLQHLSNAEIMKILAKLRAYQYIILTEHLPTQDFEANKDIIAGQGTRLKKESGVDLLAPPFNFKVKEERTLLSVSLNELAGIIVTKLYFL